LTDFALKKYISNEIRVTNYKSLLRPVVLYGSETSFYQRKTPSFEYLAKLKLQIVERAVQKRTLQTL